MLTRGAAVALALLWPFLPAEAAWTDAQRQGIVRACIKSSGAMDAAADVKADICSCVAHAITANVESAEQLTALGDDAQRLPLIFLQPCVTARGLVKEHAPTPPERNAKLRDLRKKMKGGPLPQFHGWDLEASNRYVTDCEGAARKSNPGSSAAARETYCKCTFDMTMVQFKARTEAESALRRVSSGKGTPEESWYFAGQLAACGFFAFRK